MKEVYVFEIEWRGGKKDTVTTFDRDTKKIIKRLVSCADNVADFQYSQHYAVESKKGE